MQTRVYRLPNGERLVETGWAEATGFRPDPDGRFPIDANRDGSLRSAPIFVEPRTFRRLATNGEALASYGHPSTSPLDDYLYVIDVHFVRGDALVRAMIEMGGTGPLRTRLAEEVVRLEGLVLEGSPEAPGAT